MALTLIGSVWAEGSPKGALSWLCPCGDYAVFPPPSRGSRNAYGCSCGIVLVLEGWAGPGLAAHVEGAFE